MSAEVVARIINLHEKLVDKPLIWGKFEIYGWTKLRTIANVVEIESQRFWLDKLERLTYRGLIEYVEAWKRDHQPVPLNDFGTNQLPDTLESNSVHKNNDGTAVFGFDMQENTWALKFVNENSGGAPTVNAPSFPSKTYKKFKFNLDSETEFLLKKVKQQLEKERGAVTFGEALSYVLKKLKDLEAQVESGLFEAKEVPGQLRSANAKSLPKGDQQNATNWHQIPILISKQQPICCSFPGCNEPCDEKHHPFRSSLSKNNKNLTPLCRKHHHLAHSGLIENEKQSPDKWKIQTKELPAQLQYYFDQSFTAKTDLTVRRYLVDS